MPDEQDYVSHLVTIDEALNLLPSTEAGILTFAWNLYAFTIEIEEQERLRRNENRSSDANT